MATGKRVTNFDVLADAGYLMGINAAGSYGRVAAGTVAQLVAGTSWLALSRYSPAADGTIAENPDSGAVFTDYTLGGTDDGAKLNTAIAAVIAGKYGILRIPAGQYYINTNIDLSAAETNAARGLALVGDGDSSRAHAQYGFNRMGTSLLCDTGVTISDAKQGLTIENMAIYGQSTGTFMDLGLALVDGGGLRNTTIINNAVDATYASSVAVQVTAFYTTETHNLSILGRRDYRPAWDDDSIASSALYHGTGLHCDTTGQGGIGQLDNLTISGFATGFVIEADAVASNKIISPTALHRFQANYCKVGMRFGQGTEQITLYEPFFEYFTDHAVQWHDGAGYLAVYGGRSIGVRRDYDSGGGAVSQYVKDAGYVFGDATSADCEWGGATFVGHTFAGMSNMNAGVLLYAGTGAGYVILDNCIFTGGTAVILDMTNAADGVPDVWIKNPVQEVTQGTYPADSRWICTFTRNGDYTQHTYADANWYGRIEGVTINIDAGAASAGALDFTGRRFVPYAIEPNLGVNLTITLADSVWPGQSMLVNKRFASGAVSISIPSGAALIDRTGTRTAGSATHTAVANNKTGFFRLTKVDETDWVIEHTTEGALNDLSDVNTSGLTSGDALTWNGSSWVAGDPRPQTEAYCFKVIPNGTPITTTGMKEIELLPYNFTLSEVYVTLTDPCTTGTFEVNILAAGTTIFSTRPTIDATERTSRTAATPAVLSTTALTTAQSLQLQVTDDADGTGEGLTVWFVGTRT